MEKKLDLAYSVREVVVWGFEQRGASEMFLSNPQHDNNNFYISRQVDKMLAKGWDDDKILKMCSENLPHSLNLSPRRPLPEIVVSGHPIVDRWDETDVRIALHKMSLFQIAKTKRKLFETLIETGDENYFLFEYRVHDIEVLEGFIERLTQQANPAVGIRNR